METLDHKIIKKENIKKEELWNDSLFGVPNQITESLRSQLNRMDATLKEKDSEIERLKKLLHLTKKK